MNLNDIILLFIVYLYVFIIFLIAEKALKNYEDFSRKFVHIMVGNMVFIMPFFLDSYNMVYFLTLPITIIAFLISSYSPIKIKNQVSESGHDLGLVYYAGIWTILIYLLPNQLDIVSLAIVSMAYGDGFASLIGKRYGKHKYNIVGDEKSIEGSLTMFIITILMSLIVIGFYTLIGYDVINLSIIGIIIISLISTISEALSPKGLDNITATSITAILYYVFL